MLLLKRHAALAGLLRLADDLNVLSNVAGIGRGADIVEDELAARAADTVDATGHSDLLGLVGLTRLEVVELLEELGVVVVGLELVRVWVVVGIARVEEGLDLPRPDLVVLVGVELLLLSSLGLGLSLGGSSGSLGSLLLLILARLHALLELCLGDLWIITSQLWVIEEVLAKGSDSRARQSPRPDEGWRPPRWEEPGQ